MTDKKSQTILDEIESITIDHYEFRAESFWLGTCDHDVSQNIEAFMQAMPNDKTLDILDFGCGPGRDLLVFKKLGHRPTGLDGCAAFCTMAKQQSGHPVLHQQFLNLDLEQGSFDGIFANASMFHVPRQELHRVFMDCHQALRKDGILFMSNPRGDSEGWQGERYGSYLEFEEMKSYLQNAGFEIVHHYYRPEGLSREQQPWLAVVCKAVTRTLLT